MKRIEEVLNVDEVYTMVEEGVTKPLKVRLGNGEEAIVKYPNNNCGNQVLLNEFVCGCIAQEIDINVPPFGVCQLSDEIIETLPYEWGLDVENAGLCFFSKLITSSIPVTFGTLSVVDDPSFNLARLIVFDHLICNRERHDGNMIIEMGKGQNYLYAIDHGTIFTTGVRYDARSLQEEIKDTRIFDSSIMSANEKMYKCLASRFACSNQEIEKQCKEMKAAVDDDILKKIKENVPNEWIKMAESDTIERLTNAICKRRDKLDEIASLIIRERRN